MFQKNMELELLIEDMGVNGEGIGKAEGVAFFVKDAVIGDHVLVKVMKMKKRYGYARLLKVIQPSAHRVQPLCDHYRQCGGCQIQTLEYKRQLEYKEKKVIDNLERIGGFQINHKTENGKQGILFHPIIGMEEPFFYRNKAQFPIGVDKDGKIVTGFYAARSHNIIPSRKCYLGAEENEKILELVISFMEKYHIPAYHEETGKGLVRHVLIRKGFLTGEIMVCLVLNSHTLPKAGKLVEMLRTIGGMTSIMLNINEKDTNVILGNEVVCLWGQDYISDYIGDIKYQISPLSFYQVNPIQTKKLYETALDYAGLAGKETVWDLYCGIGTISLFLAQKAKCVYGVEIVEPAVWDARKNAKLNKIENVQFFVGKAEEVLPQFYNAEIDADTDNFRQLEKELKASNRLEKGAAISKGQLNLTEMRHPDVIVVDPPRKGCDEKCLETILKMRPDRVVYISCDSATLARDLKYLCEKEYEIKQIQAVDMFPHTVHVETIVGLQRRDM